MFVLCFSYFWFFGSFSVEPLCGREDRQRDAPAPAYTSAPTPVHTTLSVVQQNSERFRGQIPVLLVVKWLGLKNMKNRLPPKNYRRIALPLKK